MHYELWDTESRNLLEDFETEAAALEASRELIELNASVYPAALALACRHDDGATTWVAGPDLARRAGLADRSEEQRRSA
jgi:hypothetical protein